MRFFRRKASSEEEIERCPRCNEAVPEGAVECVMCGWVLESVDEVPASEEAGSPRAPGAER